MITSDDKLRFELGEGFKNLSQEEIDENDNFFNKIVRLKTGKYPSFISKNKHDKFWKKVDDTFQEYLINKYKDSNENLINAVGELDNDDYYIWVLGIVDLDIVPYAVKYFSDILKTRNEYSDSEIKKILGEYYNV